MTDRAVLESFSEDEWELLCDNCALCCLYKLQDEDTNETFYTEVLCQYLNKDTRRCACYYERFEKMPTCMKISAESLPTMAAWLPKSCAYRCLYEGIQLPDWHPLFRDESPEAKELLRKLEPVCVRPNTCISFSTAERVILNSRQPRSMKKLTRLLMNHVIEDIDL